MTAAIFTTLWAAERAAKDRAAEARAAQAESERQAKEQEAARQRAIAIAERVLASPDADPDIAFLARQFIRAIGAVQT